MHRINRAARQVEQGRRMTGEEPWHDAQVPAPQRLAASQFDPLTGPILWPIELPDPRCDLERTGLEHFFALRGTSHGGLSSQNYRAVPLLDSVAPRRITAAISRSIVRSITCRRRISWSAGATQRSYRRQR
jgi:hypothetical protein